MEKARWALDWKKLTYREAYLQPGPHRLVLKNIVPTPQVPVLVHQERVVQGSSKIIDHLEEQFTNNPLTPSDPDIARQCREMEHWLDEQLGVHIRRYFYYHMLPKRRALIPLFCYGARFPVRIFYAFGYGFVRRAISKMYAISARNSILDEKILRDLFDNLNDKLRNQRYLVGSCFTRADLTLAALCGWLWRPEKHPIQLPQAPEWPPALENLVTDFLDSPVQRHVMRLYDEYRCP